MDLPQIGTLESSLECARLVFYQSWLEKLQMGPQFSVGVVCVCFPFLWDS